MKLFSISYITLETFTKYHLTKIFCYDYDEVNMKLSTARYLQKGFTLIELLVVIGILGILAAALVATIDPFEQLKKASDSKIKNIAVEFQTANVRYYTTHGAFPWNDPGNSDANCIGLEALSPFSTSLDTVEMGACIQNSLIAEGELKQSFDTNPADMEKVYVNWDASDSTNMIVCFGPESKSQKAAPDALYTSTGALNASCPNANQPSGNPATSCHWCTQ